MNKRYAVIQNDEVVNVVVWDGAVEWAPPQGSTVNLLPDDSPVSIGYLFDGENYTQPSPPPTATL